MAGRPKKPTSIKAIQGTLRPDRANKNEPKLDAQIPTTPSWLSPIAKNAFKEIAELLVDIRVITKADKKALEIMCDAYSEYRELRKVVIEHGPTFETTGVGGDTVIRARPEVAMSSDAWKRFNSQLQQFGLTPASRAKVNAMEKEPEQDPLKEFLKVGS